MTSAAEHKDGSAMLSLALPHLESFRIRTLASTPATPADWARDTTLLSGLRLNLRETLAFLNHNRPTLQAFEEWIAGTIGHPIDPARLARLNDALSERGSVSEPINATVPNVLTPEDLDFWDRNGYVVLHDAVAPEKAQAAVDAICAWLNADLANPGTWYGGRQGHSIWIPLLHHPALEANRQARRIHCAFAQLWNREDLWVNVDQAGFNPPEKPGWSFPGPNLHWDVSLARPIPLGTQAILYLTDTAADQGAFCCVPGFHKRIDSWLDGLARGADPRAIDLSPEVIPIPGRAGDLVIWHHAQPHGASPNRGAAPRIVQYLQMQPAYWEGNPVWI
jgi:hypothetical protein